MVNEKKVSVIIPAYNEEAAIEDVVRGIIKEVPEAEVIVVNDGSTDATAECSRRAGAIVLSHEQRRGYGASIKTAVRAAAADYVLICDGDGQHSPEDVAFLARRCADYDMVVGMRGKDAYAPLIRRPGKAILGVFANCLAGQKIPDFNSGLRIFNKKVLLRYLHIMPDGFSFSLTSTLAMIKSNRRICYLPIKVYKRAGKSTVFQLTDGPEIIMLMLRLSVLFEPLKVFLPISGILFLMAVAVFVLDVIASRAIEFSDATTMLFVSSVIIFMFGLLCDQICVMRREKYE